MPRQGENDPRNYRRNEDVPVVIQQQLNELTMTVGGLKQAVENLTTNWKRQDDAATSGRHALHQKIDDVREDVSDLGNRVDNLDRAVKIIEPSIAIFNEEKLRAEGARDLGRWIWGAFLAAAGFAGYWLHEFFTYLFHK